MRIVKTAEENEPADRPPDSTSDMPSAELEEEEANDPNSLASLLERVLQKVSQLPGALEALSSDPQLLHDLQEHEFLIYPITPPVSSSQDASIVHRRSIRSSSHRSNSDAQLSSDDEDLTESVDMTSELFGSEYEAELQAVESLQRGKSMNMVIPRGSSMLVAAHDLSTSPSYSMGMLSLSPGASSQDGDPVSAVLLRDVDWASLTCVLSWASQGVWGDSTDFVHAMAVAPSKKVLVCGNDKGDLNCHSFPALSKNVACTKSVESPQTPCDAQL
ncbi:hypothetical protein DYB38_003750, partial [Aphanomyces astaci]